MRKKNNFMHKGLVPITVGITGHRDIPKDDKPKLAKAVLGELVRMREEHPHSPLILLTGLAEGADRLAAKCALQAGWQIGAFLPLPQVEYEKDFES